MRKAPITSALWGVVLAGLLLVLPGCGPLVLSVEDTVVMDGHDARLVAHVKREHMLGLRTEIERVPVSFRLDGREVGQNLAGEEGRAGVTVPVPENRPATFDVRARAMGKSLDTQGRIFYWHKGRVIIAVDIDHTISETDRDKLLTTNQPETSPPIPGARDTLAALAREYYILYVTARPHFLLEKTRHWLATYHFPVGPVITAPKLSDSIRPAKWKSQVLGNLRQRWPDLLIGIGNRNSDTESYAPNDMLPLIIYSEGEELHYADAIILPDWRALGAFFEVNRDMLRDPGKLREVIEGKVWVLQPIIPLCEPKRNVRSKVLTPAVMERLHEST
jgi:hypothetical protein